MAASSVRGSFTPPVSDAAGAYVSETAGLWTQRGDGWMRSGGKHASDVGFVLSACTRFNPIW